MPMRALSDVQEAEVVVRYKLGLSAPQLAARFGVDESTIRRVLARNNVERRPRQAPAPVECTPTTVGIMRSFGHSWAEIARMVGCSPTTARQRYHVYQQQQEVTT